MRLFHHVSWATLAALVLVACDDDEVREYEDEGTVCLRPSADTLQVRIEFPTCVSSSCDTVLEKSCSAELEGNVLTFHAFTKIEGSTGECTADCGLVTADCSLPMPPPGNHLIHFGTNEGLTTRIDMEIILVPAARHGAVLLWPFTKLSPAGPKVAPVFHDGVRPRRRAGFG